MKNEKNRSVGMHLTFMVIGLLCLLTGGFVSAAAQAGGKIAYAGNIIGTTNLNIYVMDADGSDKTRLTFGDAGDAYPAFSPDGSKIAFTSNRNGNLEIYVMNVDGSNQTRLTNNPEPDFAPSFSPDGDRITFTSRRDGNDEIYVMSANGSNQTRLTNNPASDAFSTFSFNGSFIAWVSTRDGNQEIYSLDGTGQVTNLTNHPANETDPVFSPNGAFFAFTTDREGNKEVYLWNTVELFNMTQNPADDYNPSFSPASNRLAFTSDRDGNEEIYVTDGVDQTNISNSLNIDTLPSWGSAPNTVPVANPDNFSTSEDTTLNIPAPGVLANDTDNENDPLTALLATNPAHAASFTFNADGSFSYTPLPNFNGTDSFLYRAVDGALGSVATTVTITVNAIEEPPDANDDTATVAEDSVLNVINVLANDTEPDGDSLKIIGVTQPAHGSAFISDNGLTVTYVPNANYNGLDSFTYVIADRPVPPFVRTDSATVLVGVTPVEDPPNANDDSATVTENSGTNTINVLGNDTGDSLTIVAVTQPEHGFVFISGGTVSYVPQANYTGTDSFTYTIGNGSGMDTATVNITVAPAPSALVVTKTADTGDGVCDADCSLREAIAAANNGDVITFSALFDTPQVITLTNPAGQLLIDKNLTVTGKGANLLTVSGNNTVRVFYNESATVTLSGLTISGGNAGTSDGGGVFNHQGRLRLLNSVVTGNTSQAAGGIVNQGTMTITDSVISNNLATIYGGGIVNNSPFADPFTLTITNSTVSGNIANSHGGGIVNTSKLNIINSTVSGNAANSAGGGIVNLIASTLTITNGTVTGNRADADGSGGGIWNNGNAVNLLNTIVAGNTSASPASSPDFFGAVSGASSFNLIGNNRGTTGITNGVNGNEVGTDANPLDAGLAPLALNGGTTPNHALVANSPAIDKGGAASTPLAEPSSSANELKESSASASNLLPPITTDQRGLIRPVDNPSVPNSAGGDGSDIGAFEVQTAPTAATVSISGRVLTADGGGISKVRVTLTDMHGMRSALTNPFGYYRFDDVQAGETCIIEARHKRYQFAPQVVSVAEELTGLNFVALSNTESRMLSDGKFTLGANTAERDVILNVASGGIVRGNIWADGFTLNGSSRVICAACAN